MRLFARLKDALSSAFASHAHDEAFIMPEKMTVALAWPNHITSHLQANMAETIDTQTCAAKWAAVTKVMQSTLVSSSNSEHRQLIAHLNRFCGSMQMSNKTMFDVCTRDVMVPYDNRQMFDEISALLLAREPDLTNVVLLPGMQIRSGAMEAEIIMTFKDKYVEMMERALLPFYIPGWTKQSPPPAQDKWGMIAQSGPDSHPL